jgi:glutathione peroxidase
LLDVIYDIEMPRLSGQPESLSTYKGKVVMAVNVASKCGFTPQYAGLEKIYERYSDQGFTILGFPCNQFGRQEPGSAEQIEQFCRVNYGVTFPMFAKIDVKGDDQHPLFALLTETPDDAGKAGNVGWNFEKFLIDRQGNVTRRFRSRTKPEDARVTEAIEALL